VEEVSGTQRNVIDIQTWRRKVGRMYGEANEDAMRNFPYSLWGDSFFFDVMPRFSEFGINLLRMNERVYQAILNNRFSALELMTGKDEPELVAKASDNLVVQLMEGALLCSRLALKMGVLWGSESYEEGLHMYEAQRGNDGVIHNKMVVISANRPPTEMYERALVVPFILPSR